MLNETFSVIFKHRAYEFTNAQVGRDTWCIVQNNYKVKGQKTEKVLDYS